MGSCLHSDGRTDKLDYKPSDGRALTTIRRAYKGKNPFSLKD